MLAGVIVLSGCSVSEPPPAELVQAPEPERVTSAKSQPATQAGTGKSAKGVDVAKPAEDAVAGKIDQDPDRCWKPSKRMNLPGQVIEVTRDVIFIELADQLGTTVAHLNAINELQLQPGTMIAEGSEIYISRDPSIL